MFSISPQSLSSGGKSQTISSFPSYGFLFVQFFLFHMSINTFFAILKRYSRTALSISVVFVLLISYFGYFQNLLNVSSDTSAAKSESSPQFLQIISHFFDTSTAKRNENA